MKNSREVNELVMRESIKALRTNVLFTEPDKQVRTILITSSLPEEGKSFISGNLAVSFAESGKRTILVDCDMRRGTQSKRMQIYNLNGLSNYLAGFLVGEDGAPRDGFLFFSDFVKATSTPGLFLMTTGAPPANPSELLSSDRMKELIVFLRSEFDMVILDAPPVRLATDGVILSRMVDTTIIVARYNRTRMKALADARKAIERVGGHISGAVLNRVPLLGRRGGYYGYYSSDEHGGQGAR